MELLKKHNKSKSNIESGDNSINEIEQSADP